MKKQNKESMQKRYRRAITAILFIVFSTILFVNNINPILSDSTRLTVFQLNLIAWIGLIGSMIYAVWKIAGSEL